ncbi:MAG: PD-(D/E)XK nuclease family protein [Burkholderiaceae bacterium]|nr:PD-(D/E)XK nuclease family protein [Burkholderiaceae bacterium]
MQATPAGTNAAGPLWDWSAPLGELDAWIRTNGWQPSEVVVLVPFAQLMSDAKQAWAKAYPNSFVPKFETTRNWAARVGPFTPAPDDLTLDAAHDAAVSAAMLASIELPGLDHNWRQTLAPQLVSAAQSLASVVCAVAPDQRAQWLETKQVALALGTGDGFNKWESLIAALALNWAATSAYATDVLWGVAARRQCAALAVLPGLQTDALTQALLQHWAQYSGEQATYELPRLQLNAQAKDGLNDGVQAEAHAGTPNAHVYAATDAHDEASLAAACVLSHLQAQRVPVAIVAQDRLLTKRIHAQLQAAGVDWRDETGWMLSTTPIAAMLMAWLQASRVGASANQLLDFVKALPMCQAQPLASQLAGWELRLRERQRRTAEQALTELRDLAFQAEPNGPLVADVLMAWLALARDSRSPHEWREAVLRLLISSDWMLQWPDDDATQQVLRMLRLDHALLAQWLGQHSASGDAPAHQTAPVDLSRTSWDRDRQAQHLDLVLSAQTLPAALADVVQTWSVALAPAWRRMSPNTFTGWLRAGLEGGSYKPDYVGRIEVSALPMAQLLGREVGAVVIAGCDASHMPSYVNAISLWTPAQQEVLGLLDAAAQTQAAFDAWCLASSLPVLDVLWRQADGDQALQAAPWLALAQSGQDAQLNSVWLHRRTWRSGVDSRTLVGQLCHATPKPLPTLGSHTPERVSASAYQSLRDCPYRFFALQGLRLWDSAELDEAAGARDMGNWLHRVLQLFHETRAFAPNTNAVSDLQLIDHLAQQVREDMGFEAAAFLPFDGNWAQLRDGYLAWLQAHEASGHVFVGAEQRKERVLYEDYALRPDTQGDTHRGAAGRAVVTITGTIDRVDARAGSRVEVVLDYKTERLDKTKQRVKDPLEDTQLAFYAALMCAQDPQHEVQTAYLNISGQGAKGDKSDKSDKGGQGDQGNAGDKGNTGDTGNQGTSTPSGVTTQVEQTGGPAAVQAVLAAVVHDITRLQRGQPLPALGDGAVCDYCAARGLCRKDFWGDGE